MLLWIPEKVWKEGRRRFRKRNWIWLSEKGENYHGTVCNNYFFLILLWYLTYFDVDLAPLISHQWKPNWRETLVRIVRLNFENFPAILFRRKVDFIGVKSKSASKRKWLYSWNWEVVLLQTKLFILFLRKISFNGSLDDNDVITVKDLEASFASPIGQKIAFFRFHDIHFFSVSCWEVIHWQMRPSTLEKANWRF